MATITIRNLDETVKRKLQVRAALNGRSMEAEAREVIAGVLQEPANAQQGEPKEGFGTAIHKRFAALGGVDLQIPPREFSGRSVNLGQDVPETVPGAEEGLGTAIHRLFAPLGGVELQIPSRKSHRTIPTFDE
jgi:antitoxin FitA